MKFGELLSPTLNRRSKISSTIPSLKYSCSGSLLRLTNGKTAIDLSIGSEDLDSLGIKKYPSTISANTKRDDIMIFGLRFLRCSGFALRTSFRISPSS